MYVQKLVPPSMIQVRQIPHHNAICTKPLLYEYTYLPSIALINDFIHKQV